MFLCVQTSTRRKKDRESRQCTLQQELDGRLSPSLPQLKLTRLLQVLQLYKVIGAWNNNTCNTIKSWYGCILTCAWWISLHNVSVQFQYLNHWVKHKGDTISFQLRALCRQNVFFFSYFNLEHIFMCADPHPTKERQRATSVHSTKRTPWKTQLLPSTAGIESIAPGMTAV